MDVNLNAPQPVTQKAILARKRTSRGNTGGLDYVYGEENRTAVQNNGCLQGRSILRWNRRPMARY